MTAPAPIRFTFLAVTDLRRIWEAIAMPSDPWGATAADHLVQAQAFAGKFSAHCQLLAASPELGAQRDDLVHGMRSSTFERLTIWYRARGKVLEVVRVLRAAESV